MGAFIIAGIVAVVTVLLALIAEFARGMATAPSMQPSYAGSILATGLPIAALIALSHFLSHIGW